MAKAPMNRIVVFSPDRFCGFGWDGVGLFPPKEALFVVWDREVELSDC